MDTLQNSNSNEKDIIQSNEQKETQKVYFTHTKFCAFGLSKCRKGRKCIYAHTFKELNPILCKYNEECLRKEKCYYKHNNETKIQYVKRAFPEDLKRLNIILNENKKNKYIKDTQDIKDIQDIQDTPLFLDDKPFDEEEYKRLAKELFRMYYDPSFEYYSWADVNEFDSDIDIH
jgi:hypothetical protein